jgi:hypothetical protein
MNYLTYYCILEQCINIFLKLCPLFFPCKKHSAKSCAPLRMIIRPNFGHTAQVDLIDMTTKAIHGYTENSNMLHDLKVAQASQKYNQLGGEVILQV